MAPHARKAKAPSKTIQNPMTFNSGDISKHAHHSVKAQNRHGREKQLKVQGKPQKASVEAEEEDELGIRQVPLLKPARVRKVKPKKILDSLKATATYLSSIGSLEDVEIWLEEHGIKEEESLHHLRKSCRLITDLLGVQRSPLKEDSQLSGAISALGQFYIYRNGTKRVELLAPVDVFESGKNYASRKGFGFLRKIGSYFPVMYAISGYSESLQAADKLLDSIFWTQELMKFSKMWAFKFKSDGWDKVHNREEGTDHASHAENQLMLAWAYRLLAKATGSAPSLRKLHHLRRLDIQKDAEIALNDKPCVGCRLFQKELELITGINFSFIELPSLGNMVAVKNDRGYKTWKTQIHLQLEEIEQGVVEAENDKECVDVSRPATPQVGDNRKKRFEIVIPSRPASHAREIHHVADSEAESEEEITVRTRVKAKATQRQIDFDQYYHTPKSRELSKKKVRAYGIESDEEEYEPPSRSRSKVRNEDVMTPTKIITRNGLLTPPEFAEFGHDALEFVRKVSQKRMREREEEASPTPAKKNRSKH
jgi:hypothetical protein